MNYVFFMGKELLQIVQPENDSSCVLINIFAGIVGKTLDKKEIPEFTHTDMVETIRVDEEYKVHVEKKPFTINYIGGKLIISGSFRVVGSGYELQNLSIEVPKIPREYLKKLWTISQRGKNQLVKVSNPKLDHKFQAKSGVKERIIGRSIQHQILSHDKKAAKEFLANSGEDLLELENTYLYRFKLLDATSLAFSIIVTETFAGKLQVLTYGAIKDLFPNVPLPDDIDPNSVMIDDKTYEHLNVLRQPVEIPNSKGLSKGETGVID